MNCDWTSKISSLIDEELTPEESASVETHLATCAECRAAREDFMLLRRRFSAYPWQPPSLSEQQRALQSILASSASSRPAAQDAPQSKGLLAGLQFIFGARRATPALMSALALVLLAVTLGLFAYFNPRRASSVEHATHANNVPANLNTAPTGPVNLNSQQTPPAPGARSESVAQTWSGAGGNGPARASLNGNAQVPGRFKPANMMKSMGTKGPVVPVRSEIAARERVLRRLPAGREQERGPQRPQMAFKIVPGVEPTTGPENGSVAAAGRLERRLAGESRDLTARYVEQAQMLLRSFRNARLDESGSASDLAHEKQRSQKLLYQNILLRREAASAGNVPVEKLLSSLEPILIDIANLPDKPAQEDVRSIRERMQRKNLVALLQVNAAAARSN